MSKTPYEIRLELLKLANEILVTPIHIKRETAIQEFHASRETFVNETGPRDPKPFPTMPNFPNTEDILKEAEKLKAFIDG
jgi:hypothetical protein